MKNYVFAYFLAYGKQIVVPLEKPLNVCITVDVEFFAF